MRLDRLLAEAGFGSRSQVRARIRAGEVRVEGRVETRAEAQVEPTAAIDVGGATADYRERRGYMLYKPMGCVSATEDPRFPTVLDCLPPECRRGLFPVGRLDRDAEGLMLLVNDGPLAHRLISPKHEVDKVYLVHVAGALSDDAEARFAAGMRFQDFSSRPGRLERLDTTPEGLLAARITIHEGKFHQVKRMVAACGGEVKYLKRLAMGGLWLDEALTPGAYRALTEEEWRGLGL